MTKARDLANIISGGFDATDIPNLDTAKITSGTFVDARLPATALNSNVDLTTLSASNMTSGTLPDARFPATLPAVSGANLTNTGITGADQWRLTSGFTADLMPLLNLERNDNPSFTGIGTAMSLSSGIFTFPSTGIWLVSLHTEHYMNGFDREINGRIQVTQNNSTYVQVARGASFIRASSANTHTATDCSSIVDVTDTSNVKVRFGVASDQNSTTVADTSQNATFMTFIRLGDT
jgi:hypothetical protein